MKIDYMHNYLFATRTEQDLIDKSLLLDMAKVEKVPQFIKADEFAEGKSFKVSFISEFQRGGDHDKLSGTVFVMEDGKEKYKAKLSLSDSVGNEVIDQLGDDTAEWIGKELEFTTKMHGNGKRGFILAQETL